MNIEERIQAIKQSKHYAIVERVESELEGVRKLSDFSKAFKNPEALSLTNFNKGTYALNKELAPKLFESIMANIVSGVNLEIDMRIAALEKLVK